MAESAQGAAVLPVEGWISRLSGSITRLGALASGCCCPAEPGCSRGAGLEPCSPPGLAAMPVVQRPFIGLSQESDRAKAMGRLP
jgi:hypothetical protein